MKASQSPYKELKIVPTGFGSLDKILGTGGVSLRKITEISGAFSVGKTTLALSIVAQAQKEGLETLWVDCEFSFDQSYATGLGVNCEELDLIQERFAETSLDETEEWIEAHKNALVVIDSIGGLLPRAEAEKSAEGKTIGSQAKLIATFCRKIVPLLAINNVALLVLDHEFTDLMSGRLMTSGGAKLGYHKSVWVRLRKANKRLMQGDKQVGDVILAEIRKNKLAGTSKQECELQLLYGTGFNAQADIMETAKEKLFEKRGQFFYWGEEKLARGEAALRDLFKDPSFAEKVTNALKD